MPNITPIDPPLIPAPSFFDDAVFVGKQVIDLTTAHSTPQELNISGDTVWCAEASTDANVSLQFNRQSSESVKFKDGTSLTGLKFNKIYYTNTAQAGKTITLYFFTTGAPFAITNSLSVSISSSVAITSLGSVSLASTFLPVRETAPNNFVQGARSLTTATATLVTSLSGIENKWLWLQNPITNTATIYLGKDSSTDATNGTELYPGDSVFINTKDDVYAYQNSGSTVTMKFALIYHT